GRKVEAKTETAEGGNQSTVNQGVLFDVQGHVKSLLNPFFARTDNVLTYTPPPAGAAAASLTYDEADRETKLILPGGAGSRILTTSYNGWTTQVIDAELKKSETDVDAFGRVLQRRSYTDAGGLYSTTSMGYDRLGNLASVTDSGSNTTLYQFDALGQLTAVSEPSRRTTRSYYWDGTLKHIESCQGGVQTLGVCSFGATYTYDQLHRPLSAVYLDGTGPI